ncbi:MAG: T9SS type A sorting domain-containing protein [Bacteroidales bacterium]
MSFAQVGNISLEAKSGVSHTTKDENSEVLMPGDWASANQVGTYQWVDEDENPIGWIFGNNTYGHQGGAMPFEVDEEMNIIGAYVWFGAVASEGGDIHFRVMAYDGSIGDEIGSVSVPIEDIVELATGEDVTPDMYDQSMYVEFEDPVAVDGEFAFVVDYGDIEWSSHGDGVGLTCTVGSGAGEAMVMDENDDWLMATDLNAALVFDLGIFPHVEPADGGNGDEDMHTVTLNVDMTDAVAVGDVAFDPDNHDVWVTGTFADWAEPGENPDFQMEPANVAKDANGEMLYPGNWDEDTEGVLGHWAEDGGPIFGTNTYNDAGYGQIFEIDEEYHIDAAKFWIGSVAGEAGDVVFTIWDYSDGSVGDVLGDKTIPLADISASDNLEDAFTVQFDEPVHVVGDFLIGADISDLNAYDPDVYELANIHSDFDTGGEAGLALVLEGTNWVPVLNYDVDVDLAIFPILADDNGGTGDDDIYTITFEAAEGEHEYKYFLVEDEPSWDLGEWEGDPNRTLMVEEEMVVDNVWADLVSSIDDIDEDQLLSVYPNPVSSQLYVSSNSEITDITVYDITGRMLIQQTEDVIDVSGLRTGVYIIQVNTTEGTEARRFNVAR